MQVEERLFVGIYEFICGSDFRTVRMYMHSIEEAIEYAKKLSFSWEKVTVAFQQDAGKWLIVGQAEMVSNTEAKSYQNIKAGVEENHVYVQGAA